MAALGIALVVIGVALVCGGLILRPDSSRPEAAGHDGLGEMRAIISALEEGDQADENRRTP